MSAVLGSPDQVETVARLWRDRAGQCQLAEDDVRAARLDDWAGLAATMYSTKRAQVTDDLRDTGDKLLAGARVLETFVDELTAALSAAASAEADLTEASTRLRDAAGRRLRNPLDAAAEHDFWTATGSVTDAGSRQHQAEDDAQQAADRAAQALFDVLGVPGMYAAAQASLVFGGPELSVRVTRSMAADDPLNVGGTAQHGVGDCWLVSTFNAEMETAAGRRRLRDGVRWDDDLGGYQVRLYDHGKEVWIPVTHVFADGVATTSDGKAGLVSLYEAAVDQHFGHDYLWGNSPANGISILTDHGSNEYVRVDAGPIQAHISDDAIQSGGSVDGTPSIASTYGDYGGKDTIFVQGTPDPTSGRSTVTIQIHADHAYEVVDSKNGQIGLRNPWERNNPLDGPAQNSAGVFYISQADFDRAFQWQTHPEDTGPW